MADSDFSFRGVSVPDGTKRLYVTATLVPSTGDPRIQSTGFPDIGPVLYPDPSGEHGQICLIESEASMANRLEEVAVADKYTGALAPELASLPYIRVEKGERFMTASTIDGHRFASEYVMKAKLREANGDAQKGEKLVDYVKRELDGSADNIPAANVPRIFRLAMELDPLALIHGFLTFVGLRSPRALTACIVGLNAQPVGVPGVRIDPIGTGDAGQAIVRKERIVAKVIQANFAIDIGLLTGLPVGAEPAQDEKNDAANEARDLPDEMEGRDRHILPVRADRHGCHPEDRRQARRRIAPVPDRGGWPARQPLPAHSGIRKLSHVDAPSCIPLGPVLRAPVGAKPGPDRRGRVAAEPMAAAQGDCGGVVSGKPGSRSEH